MDIPTPVPTLDEAAAWLEAFRPRLRTCLFGHPHPVRVKPIEDTSQCPLGLWLSKKGAGHRGAAQLHTLHEDLHAHAREVLKAIRAGEKGRANRLLEPDSAFTRTLEATRSQVADLRGKAAEA
ncbi:MAG: CZB domain-containing protein [Acidobacteria bacterium]|nr:CZB domain-containing protein [Bacteroidota bacterium]MBS1766483.1 CZB domain-containing protein [Acidobacteriota bacterium]